MRLTDGALRYRHKPFDVNLKTGGIAMNDPDGSHSCPNMIKELTEDEIEDPGPRRLCLAADVVNGRHPIRG